jgi:histidinol-phosphate phosphatase family protein
VSTSPPPGRDGVPAPAGRDSPGAVEPGARGSAGSAVGDGGAAIRYDVVIPTTGRPSLERLLSALLHCPPPLPDRIVLVDDRPGATAGDPLTRLDGIVVRRSGGRGPAAARNVGWQAASAPWIVFLDDDVVPADDWTLRLQEDLGAVDAEGGAVADDANRGAVDANRGANDANRGAGGAVAGVQGRVRVPLPGERRPTDWERNVAGLEQARWATADLAYRRSALVAVGGFDERFRRNYREDADLGLRLIADGWSIVSGVREVTHPVGPADRWTSLRLQRGNADDVLMRALHGRDWRRRADAPRGRLPQHIVTAVSFATAVALFAVHRRKPGSIAATVWAAGTAELAGRRIAPGPRSGEEVSTMLLTSAAMPFAATAWWLLGHARAQRRRTVAPWRAIAPRDARRRTVAPWRAIAPRDARRRTVAPWRAIAPRDAIAPPDAAAQQEAVAQREAARSVVALRRAVAPPAAHARPVASAAEPPDAVLFDRDGTLVVDVPYNGDPALVLPMPGALDAVASLHDAGVPTAVISNQSGIARGLLSPEQVEAVNRRIDQLLGGVGPWVVCPHGPEDGCDCRKPQPGLVRAAAAQLGVAPERCAVIGDIGADVEAARAAGARGVLVPTTRTRREEIAAADEVAPDLLSAVRRLLESSA